MTKKTTMQRLADAIGVSVDTLRVHTKNKERSEAALREAIEHEAKRTPIYFVDETMLIEGKGYRVAIVIAGEDGYHPTGTWPYTGAVGETLPYFYGPTIEAARRTVDAVNERRGISPEVASIIVGRSMSRGSRRSR